MSTAPTKAAGHRKLLVYSAQAHTGGTTRTSDTSTHHMDLAHIRTTAHNGVHSPLLLSRGQQHSACTGLLLQAHHLLLSCHGVMVNPPTAFSSSLQAGAWAQSQQQLAAGSREAMHAHECCWRCHALAADVGVGRRHQLQLICHLQRDVLPQAHDSLGDVPSGQAGQPGSPQVSVQSPVLFCCHATTAAADTAVDGAPCAHRGLTWRSPCITAAAAAADGTELRR